MIFWWTPARAPRRTTKIIANQLRQLGRPVYLVVNKAEGLRRDYGWRRVPRAGAGRAVGDFWRAWRRRA